MDRHEPQVTNASQNESTEQSSVRRFINKTGNFLKDNKNKLTATATAGVLALSLAGCGTVANADPNPAPTKSSTGEATPTPSPETPEASDIITSQEGLDYLTFEQGDASKKRAYAMDFVKIGAERHATALEGKNRPTWTEPSVDSTGQEILDNWVYVIDEARMSTVFNAEDEAHYLDHDQAIKVLSGAYYNTDDFADNPMYRSSYNDVVGEILSHEKGYFVEGDAENYTEVASSELQEGVGPNGESIQYKDIEFAKTDGDHDAARFVYTTFENTAGEDESTWLLLNYLDQ